MPRFGRLSLDSVRAGPMSATEAPGHKRPPPSLQTSAYAGRLALELPTGVPISCEFKGGAKMPTARQAF